ncbi:MAG: hypothetical protein EPN60_00770 [Nevskiaceae bacterium]|jgi:hypothetical protein|nr:MAG: hypothetical protein EPO48_06225 [Nevskiaceae bacterium]TAM33725.1 MAG: hypothetical protein EPN60_00770 [Nevskiaceae bacterium]
MLRPYFDYQSPLGARYRYVVNVQALDAGCEWVAKLWRDGEKQPALKGRLPQPGAVASPDDERLRAAVEAAIRQADAVAA